MSYKPSPSTIRTMKERSMSSSSSKSNKQAALSLLQSNNNNNNDQPLIDEDHLSEIDSPNLLATSVENNSLLSSNSTISLLSLNKPSMSRTTSFSNPLMYQRVQFRRYSNNNGNGNLERGGINIPQPQSLRIDPVPETPNLDPISIQNSPSNFWLNKPMIKRQSSITQNVDSPFLYPVRDLDGNVTRLILSPNRNELKDDRR